MPQNWLLSCLAAFAIFCAVPAAQAQEQELPSVPIIDYQTGRAITPQDVNALEAGLAKNPDDLEARAKLIHYYFESDISSKSPEIEEKREAQIFWVIEHHPEAETAGSTEAGIMPYARRSGADAYQRAKELWMQQVEKHPSDVHVLLNAANFFQFSDSKMTSELLEKALIVAPTNTEVLSREAQFFEMERIGADTSKEKKELSEKALSFRERALQSSGAEDRSIVLDRVAVDALEAGDLSKAEQYGNELLKDSQTDKSGWNYGNEIHHGNIVLGRVALRRGDIEGAKQHLLAAGDTSGSPQLDSFGPNMSLAQELLEKGERDTVIAYLQSCAKFWKMGRGDLQNWIATIKGGGTPDFSGNLSY
jgi:tetratricopeptide (TPR) repeat protein